MPINPTTLLRHIKAQLGATTRPLPLTDDEIMEIVIEETLPTFSKFYPYFYNLSVDPRTDTLESKKQKSVYIMNTQGMEVLGVARVYRTDGSAADNRYPYYNTNNIFDIAIANNYLSATEVPQTFQFYPPNLIELYPKNFSNTPFVVIAKCIHLPSLQTIPMKLKDEFFELADIDVAIALFPILKHYDQINTPFGTIDLKINDLEDAKNRRNELIEKFTSKFMKEPERRKIWIQ